MPRVVVELYGTARSVVGAREVDVEVQAGASVRTVIAALATSQPALIGRVIAPGCAELLQSYGVNLNGRNFVADLDTPTQPGDRLLLLFTSAGG
ncbi:MAG: MoaD/ThiS family protein [Chloroflexota bacterium]